MFRYDTKTWEKIEEIMNEFGHTKENPFKLYKEQVGPLRKYAKKGNGPLITELKFIGHKVGNGIDITHKYPGAKNKVVMESLKQYRGDVYYSIENHSYHIVPIRYADFIYGKDSYTLSIEKYQTILREEGLLQEKDTFQDLKNHGYEFCYSLYRNSIIGIEEDKSYDDSGEIKFYRYQGKNHSMKNRFEYKSVTHQDPCRKYITFNRRIIVCNKYNVDILGNHYKVEKEVLKFKYHIDNNMIN